MTPPLSNVFNMFSAFLRDSEGNTKKSLSDNPIIFANAVIDNKGIIIKPGNELIQLSGYKRSQLKGVSIGKILSHGSAIQFRNLIKSIDPLNPFVSCEVTLINCDKHPMQMEIVINYFREGKTGNLFCIFRNLDPERRLINELFNIKEHYRLVAENTDYVQILLDRDFKSLYISPSCKNLTGYSIDEARMMNLFTLVHPDDFEWVWDEMNKTQNDSPVTVQFRFRNRNETYVPVECQIVRIQDDFGDVDFVVLNLHNISRQKNYELELVKAQNEAESLHQMKTNFLASITHELRTPLNAIIGFSRILEQNQNINERALFLKEIESNGVQLLGMIDNLLEYTRLEKDEFEFTRSTVNVDDFFRELTRDVREGLVKLNKENIEMVGNWKVFPDIETFQTNELILKKILLSLIDNAIKFTRVGFVKYGCQPYGIRNYLFYVQDSGIGIHEDFKEKAFDRFTQADQSMSREFGGTGLGLTLSKKLVELLGGEIWIISQNGQGTSVFFTIPLNI